MAAKKKAAKDSAEKIVRDLAKTGTVFCCVGFKRGLHSATDITGIWRWIASPTKVFALMQRAKRLLRARNKP